MMLENKRTRDVEIPTASLADIAFLLLTFFLVTTSLNTDKGLGLTLPAKGKAKPIPKQNIASLLINNQGGVMLDEERVEVNQIKDIVKNRLAQNDKLIVSIKTAERTKYQHFIRVLDQVLMANATKISIAEPAS
ncbi:MAG: biopolymer transporter ExbD [bacterium]